MKTNLVFPNSKEDNALSALSDFFFFWTKERTTASQKKRKRVCGFGELLVVVVVVVFSRTPKRNRVKNTQARERDRITNSGSFLFENDTLNIKKKP